METFQPPRPEPHGLLSDLGLGGDRAAWIEALQEGLPTGVFTTLARRLGVSEAELARTVGLSSTTLARRKRSGTLTTAEGEHVLRVAALLARATQVFEEEADAADWLRSDNLALGGVTPLTLAETEFGAREVEDLLGRLEHGVYT
ncbi:MAG: antitoxin Xre/MbcA/ParS toxin-binding domain-containing protein [Trueperaceae bacterium]|nr:antitoxin Xre/MbcA/ParS toxin-binding domain-containing protein [Trueperaceae bacterium]